MTIPARRSIRRQVPGLVGSVLAVGVLVFGGISYRAVRRSALAAADVRLNDIAEQLAGPLGAQFAELLDSVRSVASDPAVTGSVVRRARLDSAGARGALARLGPIAGDVRHVELRDLDGQVILALEDSSPRLDRPPASAEAPVDGGVGRLYALRDTTFLEVRWPVASEDEVLGHVVQLRRLAGSRESIDRLNELLGADAALMLANDDGSMATDLVRPIEVGALPPGVATYERDSLRRRVAARAVEGTPLLFAADIPETSVFAPARRLLLVFASLGVAVVGLGTLGGWIVSRRITRPLVRLAGAARTMSSGDLDVAVEGIERQDEIGELAVAFNRMAESVRLGHEALEEQVAERTAQLRSALDELQEIQDELVRKERLATLGQLSGSVGHELRNPLGVMTNAVYYLEHVLTDVPPKVTKYLGMLREHIHISEKIVSDLLDFARVKPPQRVVVSVANLAREQLTRVKVPERVKVEWRLPEDVPRVNVDSGQVGQVLLNLLTNAVQAMEEGGVLTVGAEADDSVVRLAVSDTGPGVPAGDRERIFEPLFTTKARGIGLGLSVSRSLARANGGDLSLARSLDGGAVFVLEMPAAASGP